MENKKLFDYANKPKNNNLLDTVNIAVISNISFDPFFVPLMVKKFFDSNNVYSKIFPIPLEEYNLTEHKESLSASELIIVWLNFELLFSAFCTPTTKSVGDAVMLQKNIFDDISCISKAKILWVLFEDYYDRTHVSIGHVFFNDGFVEKINIELFETLKKEVSFVDLKQLIAKVGIANAYDIKGKYRWNSLYSKTLIEAAVYEIHKHYLINKNITKKCLVLDCDNVLWGGLISEVGIENVSLSSGGLGREYQDFQRFVLSLYYRGVILAVCSRNDFVDVMTMFNNHTEMILKEEHIACFQVNWNIKPYNIKKIANALNIGLDSIVFIDDSLYEIEAVKSTLPEVTTVLYKRDMDYGQFSCFNLKNNIEITDIEKRNQTYRTNKSREVLKSQYEDDADYIKALKIVLKIHEIKLIEYNRISELTQRTNRRTNGKRLTVEDIKKRVEMENTSLYSISLSDCFSDLGIVGAFEIYGTCLTLFSLSCRALGRKVEEKMLDFIADKHTILKYEFYSTGRNDDTQAMLSTAFPNAILISNFGG
ncbi:MAG: HAD-IIIC family phosphatase [Defluviitaleaceae bacterium]|nr:HAD-IIIC family phosphatase [Defluviitaleaceae bacterium]